MQTTSDQEISKTIVRLSFQVHPERMDEFEAAYEKRAVPILKRHGLVASSEPGRETTETTFSRLFEVETPARAAELCEALGSDSAWQEVLRDLGPPLGIAGSDGLVQNGFELYSAPAGSGTVLHDSVQEGHWRTYDATDGLPGADVGTIYQDRDGYLWFATTGTGVSRYDGQVFTTFTDEHGLADILVSAILQDMEGNLWFGTIGGLTCYDGDVFTTFTTEDGLADNWVYVLLEDGDGHLWIGTRGGVSRRKGNSFTTLTTADGLPHNWVRSICQDREGVLWFGTEDGSASRYDGQNLEVLATFPSNWDLGLNTVASIQEDRDGHLWFATGGGGAIRYDGHTSTTFTTANGLADDRVDSIYQDRDGLLWFGTHQGVSSFDGKAFTTFTQRDGLVSNHVSPVLQDREGHLWFGTQSGVSCYDRGTFTTTTLATPDGLPTGGANASCQDRDGRLWFQGDGVICYDGRSYTQFTIGLPPKGGDVWSIYQDRDGHMWFGTVDGAIRYDGRSFTTFTTADGLPHNIVYSIIQGREGHLWFGTAGGASRYDGRSFTTFTTEDGLVNNRVQGVLEDREGHLWFATFRGVSRYDGDTWMSLTAEAGLSQAQAEGVNMLGVVQDRRGHLWFATRNWGVSRYDGKTFTTLTVQDGLAHNTVTSIFEDRQGHLWFTTLGGGVSRYDGQVLQTILQQDGLACNVAKGIYQLRDGDLWFATSNGYTRYRSPAPSSPPVFIDAVLADRRYEAKGDVTIPSTTELVVFEFHGISFKTRPGALVYRYRLQGSHKEWRTTTARRVEYHRLEPGDYTFEVQAVDRDLNYSDLASVRITLAPDPRIQALTEALSGSGASGEFIGNSESLRRMETQLAEVAETDLTVLILGETGTGKGLAARAIHALSPHRRGPFIQVNCGAIPEGLVESELFGHERGAFTGAFSRKLGKVELAEGGTLFLDEIGDLALEAQAKLLRVLEEGTYERVGGTRSLEADARVIAATNRDMEQMVAEGQFREDLYYRLQAFPVRVPPLRERVEDIPLLASYFTERMASHLNKSVTGLVPEALAKLEAYDWPGNVRELEHALQRAVILCKGAEIRAEHIALGFQEPGVGTEEECLDLETLETRHIRRVLDRTGWVVAGPRGAAAALGIPESTLRSRMKRLGIVRA